MYLTRVVLRVAWVPLTSGCMMMGGLGHTGPVAMAAADQSGSWQAPASMQQVEASSGDLSLTLSFPSPRSGVAVAIEARLLKGSVPHELTGAEIWLWIQTPSGGVDQLRLRRLDSSRAGIYQTQYSFGAAGSYVLTAEARTGTGADARTVKVTTRAEVGNEAYSNRHDWLMPAAILGSLGMVAMLALMMGSGPL